MRGSKPFVLFFLYEKGCSIALGRHGY